MNIFSLNMAAPLAQSALQRDVEREQAVRNIEAQIASAGTGDVANISNNTLAGKAGGKKQVTLQGTQERAKAALKNLPELLIAEAALSGKLPEDE